MLGDHTTMPRTQRVRDPVHGLIAFDKNNVLDQLAWRLIDTPEFQRLRRIKQLGVSEFVFPSATHTRFAHSIGVFHTARKLTEIIERNDERNFDRQRADVAIVAALLHDVGHGPFSHTFEGVQKSQGISKRHEKWTAEIIRNEHGNIQPLLKQYRPDGAFCEQVAGLLEAEDPIDIYHAVVSSSFDADRLDYLRRDRLMTGTGAGAIDFDWLMEHVTVGEISVEAPDKDENGGAPVHVPTFCLGRKALPAAEQFLLARYTLHEQVYFHKTTRCIEKMIAKLLRRVAMAAKNANRASRQTGLQKGHPLLAFFGREGLTLANYLSLDDIVVTGAIEQMTNAADGVIADLARRLRERRLYKTLDIRSFGHDQGRQQQEARRIDRLFAAKRQAEIVIKDEEAAINIYTQIGGDDERAHKKLYILDNNVPTEISKLSKIVAALENKTQYTRYYFEDSNDRDLVRPQRGELR